MDLEHGRFVIGETCIDATVEFGYLKYIEKLITEARSDILEKMAKDSFFGLTYDPYTSSDDDPEIIRFMCESSKIAGVGPMASVAGAIDYHVMMGLSEKGCRHMILDNDGDLGIISDVDVNIGLYTGLDGIPLFTITVNSEGKPLGICTSSGKIGHSVSLGNCDMATVIADNPILADACATKLGNLCIDNPEHAVEMICSVNGVRGCMAVCNGVVAKCGDFEINESDA